MQLSIRALDFAHLERQVRRAVDTRRRSFRDPIIGGVVARAKTERQAITELLYGLVPSLGQRYRAPEEIEDDSGLAQALIRTMRHPEAPPLRHAYLDLAGKAGDAIDRVRELAEAHPDWAWDLGAVRRALVDFLREQGGDLAVNPAQVPWMMSWGRLTGVAESLILSIVFEELGLLSAAEGTAVDSERPRVASTLSPSAAPASGDDATPAPARLASKLDMRVRPGSRRRAVPRPILKGKDLRARRMSAKLLGGSRFHDCRFDGSDLSFSSLEDTELARCSAIGVSLARCALERARFVECDLSQSSLALANLFGASIEGSSLARCVADRSLWNGATLRGVDLRRALLTDAVLDGAVFEDCDLRGADLSRKRPVLLRMATSRGTRFVRCDLRGANIAGRRLEDTSFVACAFHELQGRPAIEGAVHIERPDFSIEADGSDVRSAEELLARWSAP